MSTPNQLVANRRNARHSTGPRTPAGKARSARNAYQTGIDAQTAVLPGEDPAALEALKAEYHAFHQPLSPEARRFCDKLAFYEWLDRRYVKVQAAIYREELDAAGRAESPHALAQAYANASARLIRLQRHVDSVDREYHRSLEQLHRLEAQPPEDLVTPDLPTAQTIDPEPETQQLGSFLQTNECRPLPPGHPTLEDCPNCRKLGYLNPNCRYVLKPPENSNHVQK